MRLIVYLLMSLILLGCSTAQEKPQGKKPKMVWYNSELYAMADAGEISDKELTHAFVTAKNKCKIQSLKIPIPPPSCSTIPAPDCTGTVGFAAGLCGTQRAHQRCDYSSVDAAYVARKEVFTSCMNLDGWELEEELPDKPPVTGNPREDVFECLVWGLKLTDQVYSENGAQHTIYTKKNINDFLDRFDRDALKKAKETCSMGATRELGNLLGAMRIIITENLKENEVNP